MAEDEPIPHKDSHIFVDVHGSGEYALMDQPPGWDHDRRMLLEDGTNVEHVDDRDGIWCYRKM